MLSFLPSPLKGALSFMIYLINTILLTIPLILVSLLKFILPFQPVVVILDRILMGIAGLWIYINSVTTDLFCKIDWDIRGLDKLNPKQWYLVLSNHQSWVDILVLQKTLRKKIPMLKFFLKKELIWVPFLGLAWWALDFPFMKRYSKEFLAQNPHLKGKDLESTRKACRKFKHTPVSIMNFVEGTRYTPEKATKSAFSHLLTPKAGGIAFVLGSMGQYLNHIIDVTIVYPGRFPVSGLSSPAKPGRSSWIFSCWKWDGTSREIISTIRISKRTSVIGSTSCGLKKIKKSNSSCTRKWRPSPR